MSKDIRIDKNVFHDRLSHLVSQWKADRRAGDVSFGGANSIIIIMGKTDEGAGYQKNNALHFWLLGYEFPATLFVMTTEKMLIITTAKKARHLEPLRNGRTPVEILIRTKDADHNLAIFKQAAEAVKTAGSRVGEIANDKSAGPFVDEWKTVIEPVKSSLETVDIALGLSTVALSIKDEPELRSMRSASMACAAIMSPWFIEEMSEVIDSEKKMSHHALSNKIDKKIDEPKFWKSVVKPKLPGDFDSSQLDWCYGPVVQSGGKYDLRISAQSDERNIHAGIIIAAFGLRYQTYCSMIARTFLIDPNKTQESNYRLLLNIHEAIIKDIKEGVVGKDLYNKGLGYVKAKRPELEKHFLKNVGYGIGIETKDSNLILNGKCTRALKDGMTLCISTGFQDVENPNPQDSKSSIYSLLLTDVVRVQVDKGVVFTKDAPTDLESTSFFFKDEAEDNAPSAKPREKKDPKVGAVATQNITTQRLRAERTTVADDGAEQRRREHQKELAKKKQEEGLERFAEASGDMNGGQAKVFKRFESYRRFEFGGEVRKLKVFVDIKNSSIVLPIMGRPVPFHINTVKNASRSIEGDIAYLRINFLSPGQGVGKKDDHPFEDSSAHFVRSLTFKSADMDHMAHVANQITELKKNVLKREQEKKQLEDVVEQAELSEIRHRKAQRLPEVFVRPGMDGKRVAGEVQIHHNGIRYQSPLRGDQRIDILFSNIKHLFFQPCDHELIVIIHVHLKTPIMIGKKKAKDVQFYREATDIQFDETGNRKKKYRFGDEEEFEAEQQERRRRNELNKEFKKFAEMLAEAGRNDNVDVDIPFRDLSFNGVPNRASVLCQPSTDCLVQLTEPPFMVISLEDIEVAHLERVQFGLKNFDMVFVFKDFQRTPFHINTIPVESLEGVKEWLDSVNIPYSEGPLNLNWGTIMKTVTADPHAFFIEGGWSFLAAESDDEDEDTEDEDSVFEASDADLASEESSEEDSDFDEEASAEASEDGSDSESGGEDWDEMEAKAARKDKDSGLNDEEGGRKRKR